MPENVRATTRYVGGIGPSNYTTIQDAINASFPGDTVYVYSGTYYEHVTIPDPLSLLGEDRNTTIIDGGGSSNVVTVLADYVNITGFNITNGAMPYKYAAIYLNGVENCRIEGNNLSNAGHGVFGEYSGWNTISNNIIYNSDWSGIQLKYSGNTTISDNVNIHSFFGAVELEYSHHVTIRDNNFTVRYGDLHNNGIELRHSTNNYVVNNVITNGSIYIVWSSWYNRVENNNVSFGGPYGIYLTESSYNEVRGNYVWNTSFGGIMSRRSMYNVIADNYVGWNKWYGIELDWSTYNEVTNNRIFNHGIFIDGNEPLHYNSHTILSDNLANGRPIYYYKNCNGIDIDGIPVGNLILVSCNNVMIRNLQISDVDRGIEVAYSTNINITGNSLSNSYEGIYFYSSSINSIVGNDISNNYHGMYIFWSSNDNLISSNTVTSSIWYSIWIRESSGNDIMGNNIHHNDGGIDIFMSDNIDVVGNDIWNDGGGIGISSSSNCRVYHNNIIESGGYSDPFYTNFWDDGYPSGGNFWGDYDGVDNCSGANQNICPDPDDIGDTPYVINSDIKDNYPLMLAYGGDRFPPRVSIVFPTEGKVVHSTPITVRGWAEDMADSGVKIVVVRVNNGPWREALGTSSWNISVDLVEGSNLIEARAWDGVNNPSDIDYVNVTYTLAGTVLGRVVTSSFDPIVNAQVDLERQDGFLNLTDSTDTGGVFTFPDIPPGVYTFTITATGYEDLMLENIPVPPATLDLGDIVMTDINDPPTASFTLSPSTGNSSTVFSVDASPSSDPEDSLADLEFRWDWEDDGVWDIPWTNTNTAQHQYTSPGTYRIHLEVKDTGGLTNNTTKEVVVTPQPNQPPTCTITAPTGGTTLSGTYTLEGVASDPDGSVQRVVIRIDSGGWIQVTGTASWGYDWHSSTVPNGEHTIDARSYDGTDYSTEARVTIAVHNAPPQEPYRDWLWMAIATVLLIVIAVLLTILILIVRRKKRPETVESPEDSPAEEEL